METNKIPTAEEILTKHNGNDSWTNNQDAKDAMIEFAKLHVKAALETAFIKIKEDAMDTYGSDVPDCWSDSSILNAYPENLIR